MSPGDEELQEAALELGEARAAQNDKRLVEALTNYACLQYDAGNKVDALLLNSEAVSTMRPLFDADPDYWYVEFNDSLVMLAFLQLDDFPDEARNTANEAVEETRRLYAANRDRYRGALVSDLRALAICISDFALRLDIVGEITDLCRAEFNASGSNEAKRQLIRALREESFILNKLEQDDSILVKEAIMLCEELEAVDDGPSMKGELASLLIGLRSGSESQEEVLRRYERIAKEYKIVIEQLRVATMASSSDDDERQLVSALHLYSAVLSVLDRRSAAADASGEAVDRIRRLEAVDGSQHGAALVSCLSDHARHLHLNDRSDEAIPLVKEALRTLNDNQRLSASLHETFVQNAFSYLCDYYAHAGHFDLALKSARKAAQLYKELIQQTKSRRALIEFARSSRRNAVALGCADDATDEYKVSALDMARFALSILHKHDSPNEELKAALITVAERLDALGQFVEASEYRTEAELVDPPQINQATL